MYDAFNAGIEQAAREFNLATPPLALIGVEILFEPGILIEDGRRGGKAIPPLCQGSVALFDEHLQSSVRRPPGAATSSGNRSAPYSSAMAGLVLPMPDAPLLRATRVTSGCWSSSPVRRCAPGAAPLSPARCRPPWTVVGGCVGRGFGVAAGQVGEGVLELGRPDDLDASNLPIAAPGQRQSPPKGAAPADSHAALAYVPTAAAAQEKRAARARSAGRDPAPRNKGFKYGLQHQDRWSTHIGTGVGQAPRYGDTWSDVGRSGAFIVAFIRGFFKKLD
ncbi:hypothetical protein ACTMTI_45785 [Nonomuraea sp. H19]|uniref:hypothetical protein n=1 Tax=Nonomuraea sp. H19 TaxID=3452206 RepID=UPI003F8B32C7